MRDEKKKTGDEMEKKESSKLKRITKNFLIGLGGFALLVCILSFFFCNYFVKVRTSHGWQPIICSKYFSGEENGFERVLKIKLTYETSSVFAMSDDGETDFDTSELISQMIDMYSKQFEDVFSTEFPQFYEESQKIQEKFEPYGALSALYNVMEYWEDTYHKWSGEEYEPKVLVQATDTILKFYVESIDKHGSYAIMNEVTNYQNKMNGVYDIGIRFICSTTDEPYLTVSDVASLSPAKKAGVEVGDTVYAINGISITEQKFGILYNNIKNGKITDIRLQMSSDPSDIISFTMESIPLKTVFLTWEDSIAVIKITGFFNDTFNQFKEILAEALDNGATGLMFDVRNNPGGRVSEVSAILDLLVDKGELFTSEFIFHSTVTETKTDGISLPIVILTSKNTASCAEIFTSVLQQKNQAFVIGDVTKGLGTILSPITFTNSDGTQSMFSYSTAYYNREIDEHGVIPDFYFDEDTRPEVVYLNGIYNAKRLAQ